MSRRYLLDTGIMGDLINRRRGVDVRVREARQRGARIGTCLPVVAELLAGIELSSSRDRNLPRLVAALSRIVCGHSTGRLRRSTGGSTPSFAVRGRSSSKLICRSLPSPGALAIAR